MLLSCTPRTLLPKEERTLKRSRSRHSPDSLTILVFFSVFVLFLNWGNYTIVNVPRF